MMFVIGLKKLSHCGWDLAAHGSSFTHGRKETSLTTAPHAIAARGSESFNAL